MKEFERLHSQENKEQAIISKLELSMRLRDTCEKLLQEKGNNSFSFSRAFYRGFFWSADMIDGTDRSIEKIRYRRVVLKGEENKEQKITLIASTGVNPFKAKFVEIYFLLRNSKGRYNEPEECLRLEDKQMGIFMRSKRQVTMPAKMATAEDLLYYQSQINQSSPIEHK